MSQDFERQEEAGPESAPTRPPRVGRDVRLDPAHRTPESGSLDWLIRQSLAGDRPSQNDLFRVLRPSVLLFVRTQMSASLRAACEDDDICQDVLYDVCRSLNRCSYDYHGEASFRRWLRTIVLNRIRDLIDHEGAEKRRRSGVLAIDAMTADERDRYTIDRTADTDETELRESIDQLMLAIDRLELEDAELVRLVDFEQMSVNQAAKRLGLSEPTARRRHNRALALIAFFLGSNAD